MKLSDYIATFLKSNGVDTVFGYQGSSISHTIDSICRCDGITFVENRHEQAAAFAANGYALAKNHVGVAISCSGPGATNLITGIADAYYDSLPCLFISGQVSTREMRKNNDIRQFGFQETDIVSLVAPITKYAVTIMDPSRIAYEMEKAMYLMKDGRHGPVLLDIPHNVQGSNIDVEQLEHFVLPTVHTNTNLSVLCQEITEMISKSERPVLLLGGGCRALIVDQGSVGFLENISIPIVSSYRGKDIINNYSSNYCGTLGIYGNRSANLAVKHCDLLLVLGSRLDGRQTGGDYAQFADNAKVVVIDLDEAELDQMPDSYKKICADVRCFVSVLSTNTFVKKDVWLSLVKKWSERYPDDCEYTILDKVNPNKFLQKLSNMVNKEVIFTLDVGQNQLWGNTSLKIGKESTLLQSCGLGTMGFALPAAIGGYCASHKQTICICGDGGFQMNVQELQTIISQNIPIKIFVLNNQSLGLIRVYQSKALNNRFFGSVDGFGSPDYEILAKAYGILYDKIEDNKYDEKLKDVLAVDGPCLVEVCVSENSTCYPEPTYLSTIENQSPILTDDEKNTIRLEVGKLYGE